MYINYNPNPFGTRVGDCTVRAISKALNQDWRTTYIDLCLYGLLDCDMPSANVVWGRYMKDKGFSRHVIEADKDDTYTVNDFAEEHQKGVYLLAISGHVVTVDDGNYYDAWDSGNCIPIYYWRK